MLNNFIFVEFMKHFFHILIMLKFQGTINYIADYFYNKDLCCISQIFYFKQF